VDPNGACFSSHLRMSLSDLRSGFTAKLATIQTRPRATTVTAVKTPRRIGLTRIRLQLAIYFCLHGGKFVRKHRKFASSLVRLGLNVQFHHRMNFPNSVVRHVFATVVLLLRCMAYVPHRFSNGL